MSLLDARGITKTFAGIDALRDISIAVDEGTAVGLIGPNGAGKTTFFNCLLGLTRPDAGTVVLDGRDVTRAPVHRRARLGIGRTFQRIELFGGMTVRDHLIVADRAHRGDGRLWKDLIGRGRTTAEETARADAMLELLGLLSAAEAPIETLSLGLGRLVEVGRALMTEPRLLLLDEPSSGLDERETAALGATIRAVREEKGTALLLVEHDVDFVRAMVERLYVLDFGQLIAEGSTNDVLADAAVRTAYLGEMADT